MYGYHSISIAFIGYPTPKINWLDNHGNYIKRYSKFDSFHLDRWAELTISYPGINDSGNYTFHADNGRMQREHKFELLIEGMVDNDF